MHPSQPPADRSNAAASELPLQPRRLRGERRQSAPRPARSPVPSHSPAPEPNRDLAASIDVPWNARRAIALIHGWTDLSDDRRRRLASDLKRVVKMAALPATNVLVAPTFLRQHALNGSAAQHGVSKYRMRNLRSSMRFILRRNGLIDAENVPLRPAWVECLNRLGGHKYDRNALIGIAKIGSVRGIPPERVHTMGETILTYLVERTLTVKPHKAFGRVRRVWNRCCTTIENWPGQPFPAMTVAARSFILPLSAFQEIFRMDVAAFGDRLTATFLDGPYEETPDPLGSGGSPPATSCPKPLRASSAALRQSHARWAASALVATGVPIEAVTSLACLVTPTERARDILRFLYERAGGKPSAAGMHVSEVLRMIARYHVCLPEQEIARMRRWAAPVKLTYKGMTPKNDARIRAAMLPSHESKLRELPTAYLEAARELLAESPRQACSLALRGTVIQLLSRRPLRLANLRGLRLDRHLQRDDPKRGRITHISVPPEETKNNRPISLPVARDIADVLEEWISRFRPVNASPDCLYLFPGDGTGNRPIGAQGLRDAVKSATKNYVGVELSPHQFRHLGARTLLDEFPGQYESVRQLLGNGSLQTIVRHYSGTEEEATARRFDEVILGRSRRLKPSSSKSRPAGTSHRRRR